MATNRRQFLVVGGTAVAGAVALAACSSAPVVNSSGTIASTDVPATAPQPTISPDDKASDQAQLRTSTALEASIVKFYDAMLGSKLVSSPDVKAQATAFRQHHAEHVTHLQDATAGNGGTAFTTSNSYVDKNLVAPALATAESEDDFVKVAATLEEAAASTNTLAVSTLAAVGARQQIMAVGAADARFVAAWNLMAAGGSLADGAPDAFQSSRDALGSASAVK